VAHFSRPADGPPPKPYRLELTAELRPELEASCARALWHQNRGSAGRARALREKTGVGRWGRPVGLTLTVLGLVVCVATLAAGSRAPAVVVETVLFVLALPVFVKLRALQAAATRWSDAFARRRIASSAASWARRSLAELPFSVDYDLKDGVLESLATLPGVVRGSAGRCPACGTALVKRAAAPADASGAAAAPASGAAAAGAAASRESAPADASGAAAAAASGAAAAPASGAAAAPASGAAAAGAAASRESAPADASGAAASGAAPSREAASGAAAPREAAPRVAAPEAWVCPKHPPRVEAWRFDFRDAPHVLLAGRTACFFRDERALLPMRLIWCPDDAALERVKVALSTCGGKLIVLPEEAPMVTYAAG